MPWLSLLKTKSGLLLLLVVCLVIIPLVLYLLFSHKSGSQTISQLPGSNPTMTTTPSPAQIPTRFLTPTPTFTQQQIQQGTAAGDKSYGDYWKQVYADYPWYDNFPVRTDLYFVYFDIEAKSFVANIYPKQASSESTDAQVTFAKQAIREKLVSLGVNPDHYPIQWKITVQ